MKWAVVGLAPHFQNKQLDMRYAHSLYETSESYAVRSGYTWKSVAWILSTIRFKDTERQANGVDQNKPLCAFREAYI